MYLRKITVIFLLFISGHGLCAEENPIHIKFNAPLLKGSNLSFNSQQLNKPALVIFWASWCKYCMAELPNLIKQHQNRQGTVDFIGVNVNANPADGLQIEEKYSIPYVSVSDPKLIVGDMFGVKGTPSLFLFNASGELLLKSRRLDKTLLSALNSLMQ